MSMKRICVSYSYYFNKKYNRVGHVFQDRFRSERIENDEYLLECMRYIHNNPIKAAIVSSPKDYIFSSYNIYINKDGDELELITKEFLLSIFSDNNNNNNAVNEFIKFSNESGRLDFMDVSDNDNVSDIDPLDEIEKILKRYNHTIETILEHKDFKERNLILKDIRENTNIPVTEISRVIGISKYVIYRA